MIAEVVLTPNQSKRIIAKYVFNMPSVEEALTNSKIVIHPSSTTSFLLIELFGYIPEGVWVLGVIKNGAMCISAERQVLGEKFYTGGNPLDFPFSWVIDRGILLKERLSLGNLLEEMGPKDIYIKGCNALDPERNAGVLFAGPHGGTIAEVMKASRKNEFSIILPVGLEKMIPLPIKTAAKMAPYKKINCSMGQRVGLIPVKGYVISEDNALAGLTGTRVTPLAAGGLGEAQGATILSVKGEKKSIEKVWEIIDEVKYSELPPLHETNCKQCTQKRCSFYNSD